MKSHSSLCGLSIDFCIDGETFDHGFQQGSTGCTCVASTRKRVGMGERESGTRIACVTIRI